ncbi:MAG: hypothetical protein PHW33_04865 [Candidatus Portnoybacteria bacterium]|jgi:hypothetical protein|nr:hypothetical protein [Candidatus Portnoybacteria bacterium]
MAMTKAEGVKALEDAKGKLAKASSRDETLAILLEAGKAVGYSPAMRCLVAGKAPEESIKWG